MAEIFKARILGKKAEKAWIAGRVYKDADRVFIHGDPLDNKNFSDIMAPVDPASLCRCTWFTDKNYDYIFENDIVKSYNKMPETYSTCRVAYDEKKSEYCLVDIENGHSYALSDIGIYEVIGNAFDNPEFLKEGTNENP